MQPAPSTTTVTPVCARWRRIVGGGCLFALALAGCDLAPPVVADHDGGPAAPSPSASPSGTASASPPASPSASPAPSPSAAPPAPPPASIPPGGFREGFEDGLSPEWNEELCCAHSGQIVSSPVRDGGHAYQIDWRPPGDGERAEIAGDPVDQTRSTTFAFSVYLPDGFPVGESAGHFVFQAHASRTGDEQLGGLGGPNLGIRVSRDGQWEVWRRWSTAQPITQRSQGTTEVTPIGPAGTARWTDFVIAVDTWSTGDDGLTRVYRDGQMVHDARGGNSYNRQRGPYPKFGIYDGGGTLRAARTLYYDEISVVEGE